MHVFDSVLQVRMSNKNDLGVIIHIPSSKTYFVTHH